MAHVDAQDNMEEKESQSLGSAVGEPAVDRNFYKTYGTYDRIEITEAECYNELGFCFPDWKKWTILSVIFIVQVSMNFTPVSTRTVWPASRRSCTSASRLLVAVLPSSSSSTLSAASSGRLGRRSVAAGRHAALALIRQSVPVARCPGSQLCLSNDPAVPSAVWPRPVAPSPSAWLPTCGKPTTSSTPSPLSSSPRSAAPSSAPSSVALSKPTCTGDGAYGSSSSSASSSRSLHFFLVPETRSTCLMDKAAKRRRTEGRAVRQACQRLGPRRACPFRRAFHHVRGRATWVRPFKMFLTEPIVLTLSLLSGFSDALIFMFLQSYGLVYKQWGFTAIDIGIPSSPSASATCWPGCPSSPPSSAISTSVAPSPTMSTRSTSRVSGGCCTRCHACPLA